ncbi:anhydro-N-acetylmuramic acid kinase [Hymenobacter ruricola]|uniref:anhydro-N-acetylmuramic acid kinase n=1 Tax=Hymenobacter ruricola TaxID=2791023 RepID=UPI00293D6ED1|nr:anhydro-N-acetylmuramic acid kinase [Hymenobacter ruricola]
MSRQPARRIIGLMSGTSLDGLDVALCRCEGHGAALKVTLEQFASIPYTPEEQQQLRAISQPQVSLTALTLANAAVARRHAAAVQTCLWQWQLRPADIDLLASHGQTIWHAPRHQHQQAGYPHHATLQIGDGDHLAALTGIITVADFRQKHVAHGFEGAPLAGFADQLLFASPTENRLLLNLGGIANFTYLPAVSVPGPALTTDTGPANTLLDAATRRHFPGQLYDSGGRLAAIGTPHPALLAALLAHPFFNAPLPKTTGPELFSLAYVEAAQVQTQTTEISPTDLLATLVELSAAGVAQAVQKAVPDADLAQTVVYASGGGQHNDTLMTALQRQLPSVRLASIEALGISTDAKEAVLFAVLANETIAGTPTLSLGKICLP